MPRSRLFSPITVGSLEIRNRLWMPPMCMYSAPSDGPHMGQPTQWHQVHYAERALGGAGAIIVEATGVVPEGRISHVCLSLHNDDQIPAFRSLAESIHAGGAAAFIQLNHAGRKGSGRADWVGGHVSPDEGGWEVVAPSPVPFTADFPQPRALSADEVAELPSLYAAAAARALEAGFDGIQIHAAHGYLIQEFLSPFSNQRDDEYGGDLAARSRLVLEVTRAIRAEIGSAPLLIRISATDWTTENPEDQRPGWTLEESETLAPQLVEAGVDMINVSTGGNVADAKIPIGIGYQVFAADAVRRSLAVAGRSVPVSTCGLIINAQQAEQILLDERADVVETGRVLLTDPMAPLAWAGQLRQDIPVPPQYLRGTRR